MMFILLNLVSLIAAAPANPPPLLNHAASAAGRPPRIRLPRFTALVTARVNAAAAAVAGRAAVAASRSAVRAKLRKVVAKAAK
jgi:hypothetical protein